MVFSELRPWRDVWLRAARPVTKKFGKDVKKGLWLTPNIKTASAIIITESAIDALSHSRLYAFVDSAYCAMGGSIGSRQRDLPSQVCSLKPVIGMLW